MDEHPLAWSPSGQRRETNRLTAGTAVASVLGLLTRVWWPAAWSYSHADGHRETGVRAHADRYGDSRAVLARTFQHPSEAPSRIRGNWNQQMAILELLPKVAPGLSA